MAASATEDATRKRAARRAPAGVPHRHAPVPVRALRGAVPRLGPRAAPRRRRVVRASRRALAYQAVKYRQREGWRHRDLLRLAHPGAQTGAGNPRLPVSDEHARLFEWIVRGGAADGLPRARRGVRAGSGARDRRRESARLIARVQPAARGYPAGVPDSAEVWEALLERHADDGADPQPGDADARGPDRAGLARRPSRSLAQLGDAERLRRRACTRSRCWRR